MWTFEEREEESELTSQSAVFWLDLFQNEFFVVQQKVKEANKNSTGTTIADNRYCLVDIHRFSGVIPPAFWQTLPAAQFRISTQHALTKHKKYVVISVTENLREIEIKWNIVRNIVTMNIQSAGFANLDKNNVYIIEEYLHFLLLHISALYHLHEHSKPKCEKTNSLKMSIMQENEHNKQLEDMRKKRRTIVKLNSREPSKDDLNTENSFSASEKRSNTPKRRSQSFLSSISRNSMPLFFTIKSENSSTLDKDSEIGFQVFNINEPLLSLNHCLMIAPSLSSSSPSTTRRSTLRNSNEQSKQTVLVGTLYVSESYLCYYSRSPNDIQLKFPLIAIQKIDTIEKLGSFKHILIIQFSNREFRFFGIKNISEIVTQIQSTRNAFLSKQLTSLHEKLSSSNNSQNSILQRFFSRKTRSHHHHYHHIYSSNSNSNNSNNNNHYHSIAKIPIFDFPFSIYSPYHHPNYDDSVVISLIINDDPKIQGTLYLFNYLSIFISSEQNTLVSFIYKNIVNIIENAYFFEVIVQMSDISSQFILKFPNEQFVSLFIEQWVSIRRSEEDFRQFGFPVMLSSFNCEEKQDLLCKVLPEENPFMKTLWDRFYTIHGFDTIRTNLFRNLIRSGIPNHLRGKIWKMTSGVCYKQIDSTVDIPYQYLLDLYANRNSLAISEILRDIERSLPEHSYYQTEEGLNALKRVLIAFSWRNTAIGYCQSMNLITALLLLYMSEEETYQFLCIICEEFLQNYYNRSMEGSLIDQQILRSLLEQYIPSVHSHFASLEVPIAVITLPWFLCIFIRIIPWPASLRVLDVFFAEGRKTLFQVSLAIFKMFENDILITKDGIEVILLMKTLLDVVDADKLIRIAFEDFGDLSAELIDQLYQRHRPQILKEIKENQLLESQAKKVDTCTNNIVLLSAVQEDKFDSPNNQPNQSCQLVNGAPKETSPKKESTFWLIKKSFKLRQNNADIQKVLSGIESKQKEQNSSLIQEIDQDLFENDEF